MLIYIYIYINIYIYRERERVCVSFEENNKDSNTSNGFYLTQLRALQETEWLNGFLLPRNFPTENAT